MGRSRGLLRPKVKMPGMEHVKQTTAPNRARAVFLDALGTIVDLEPPWEHLGVTLGQPVDDRLIRAVKAEMAYYKSHSHEGRDGPSLAALRKRCAALLSSELGREVDVTTMMASLRFRAYPDAAPALARLRERGLRLACVSNWDCSLSEVLARCGLTGLLDTVVTSAEAGARKPDPAIFTAALEATGVEPREAVHVGDTPSEDVAGARAAGIEPLLLDRAGAGDISSLAGIESRLDTMPG